VLPVSAAMAFIGKTLLIAGANLAHPLAGNRGTESILWQFELACNRLGRDWESCGRHVLNWPTD
jgi:hypothetical protein